MDINSLIFFGYLGIEVVELFLVDIRNAFAKSSRSPDPAHHCKIPYAWIVVREAQ